MRAFNAVLLASGWIAEVQLVLKGSWLDCSSDSREEGKGETLEHQVSWEHDFETLMKRL